jgi:hypothetical protein
MRAGTILLCATALGFAVHLAAAIDAAEATVARTLSRPLSRPSAGALTQPAGCRSSSRSPASARAGPRLLELATELLAMIDAGSRLAKSVACRIVAISDALAVIDLVLPAIAVADIVAVEVSVDVGRSVGVHVDVTVAAPVTPVPAAEDGAGRGEAQAPHEAPRQGAAKRPVEGGIGR